MKNYGVSFLMVAVWFLWLICVCFGVCPLWVGIFLPFPTFLVFLTEYIVEEVGDFNDVFEFKELAESKIKENNYRLAKYFWVSAVSATIIIAFVSSFSL